MIVAGVQAIFIQDKETKDFLCQNLHVMSVELGTGAMQDAAWLLSTSFEKQQRLWTVSSDASRMSWDEIFKESPLFLM